MSNYLIELEDGLLIEVEEPPDQVRQISGGMPDKVDKAIDSVQPVLLQACRPVISAWSKLSKEMSITSAEVMFEIGFSASGSVFLAKASGNANLKIKLSISPKADKF